MHEKTALHLENNVGKPLGIGTNLICLSFRDRCGCSHKKGGDKLKCGENVSIRHREHSSIPHLDHNGRARTNVCTWLETTKRIGSTQAKERVRFLPANRREFSIFEFSADIMRALAAVAKIDKQRCGNPGQTEKVVGSAHHFEDHRTNKLQKCDKCRDRISG